MACVAKPVQLQNGFLKHRNGMETKCALPRTTKHYLKNQNLKINLDGTCDWYFRGCV
jgi:hypothetical protein